MNVEQFERTLRQSLRREPFEPFIVELIDGRVIRFDRPKLALGGGGASFLTPNYELVEFACEEVRAIYPAVQGAAS
jgi:hypothetical protein